MSELQSWIDALGAVGATGDGGIYRAPYTPAERDAQEVVGGWMREAALRVRWDAVGNLWGRVDGTAAEVPAIVVGSHLDSVRNGGNYDGPFGVLGGLRAVRELVQRYGPPVLPMEVAAFTGEEGSRFPIGLMGSRAVAGTLAGRLLDETVDDQGISVAEAMRQAGLDPTRHADARRTDLGAYLEMHIEQGPVLETSGVPIGIVQSIVGTQRVIVTVHGRADHAGTTPMHLRRDALLGAARMIARFPGVAAESGSGVVTVGRIFAFPNATNVVSGRVEFTLDIRHLDQAVKIGTVEQARELCEEIASEAGLEVTWRLPAPGGAPVALSPLVLDLLRESCAERGIAYLDMPSGATHDAQPMASLCPTGMLFIPCREGRSHSPQEFATTEAMETAVAVLSGCLHRLAYEDALGLASRGC